MSAAAKTIRTANTGVAIGPQGHAAALVIGIGSSI